MSNSNQTEDGSTVWYMVSILNYHYYHYFFLIIIMNLQKHQRVITYHYSIHIHTRRKCWFDKKNCNLPAINVLTPFYDNMSRKQAHMIARMRVYLYSAIALRCQTTICIQRRIFLQWERKFPTIYDKKMNSLHTKMSTISLRILLHTEFPRIIRFC